MVKKFTELVLGDDRVVSSERIRASLKIFRAYSELVSRTFEQSRYGGVGIFRIDVRYCRNPTTTMGQITFLYYISTVQTNDVIFRFSSYNQFTSYVIIYSRDLATAIIFRWFPGQSDRLTGDLFVL